MKPTALAISIRMLPRNWKGFILMLPRQISTTLILRIIGLTDMHHL